MSKSNRKPANRMEKVVKLLKSILKISKLVLRIAKVLKALFDLIGETLIYTSVVCEKCLHGFRSYLARQI